MNTFQSVCLNLCLNLKSVSVNFRLEIEHRNWVTDSYWKFNSIQSFIFSSSRTQFHFSPFQTVSVHLSWIAVDLFLISFLAFSVSVSYIWIHWPLTDSILIFKIDSYANISVNHSCTDSFRSFKSDSVYFSQSQSQNSRFQTVHFSSDISPVQYRTLSFSRTFSVHFSHSYSIQFSRSYSVQFSRTFYIQLIQFWFYDSIKQNSRFSCLHLSSQNIHTQSTISELNITETEPNTTEIEPTRTEHDWNRINNNRTRLKQNLFASYSITTQGSDTTC